MELRLNTRNDWFQVIGILGSICSIIGESLFSLFNISSSGLTFMMIVLLFLSILALGMSQYNNDDKSNISNSLSMYGVLAVITYMLGTHLAIASDIRFFHCFIGLLMALVGYLCIGWLLAKTPPKVNLENVKHIPNSMLQIGIALQVLYLIFAIIRNIFSQNPFFSIMSGFLIILLCFVWVVVWMFFINILHSPPKDDTSFGTQNY